MTKPRNEDSAFHQGQIAGSGTAGPPIPNPFGDQSIEHHNFEVGRRFGAANFGPVGTILPAASVLQDFIGTSNRP